MTSTETQQITPARSDRAAFVIFGICGTLYGVDALAVREVVPRPALAHVVGAPTSCAGLLDLRGSAVPVLDVSVLLGGGVQPPCIHDHIIIVESEAGRTGLLVGEICEVRSIAPADVQAVPVQAAPRLAANVGGVQPTPTSPLRLALPFNGTAGGQEHEKVPGAEVHPGTSPESMVQGVSRLDDELILLLNLPVLLASTNSLSSHTVASHALHAAETATPDEGEAAFDILRARAATLRQVPTAENATDENTSHGIMSTDDGVGVAVVTLGGEAFGLALESVREFCRVGTVTPVPCCPPHVLGQMNLRGDLLTLLDLRAPLGLAQPTPLTELKPNTSAAMNSASEMAVVVEMDGIRAGVVVEDVREVTHLRESNHLREADAWRNAPSARDGDGSTASVRLPWGGTLPWGDTALNLLDLAQFLSRPELRVREEV